MRNGEHLRTNFGGRKRHTRNTKLVSGVVQRKQPQRRDVKLNARQPRNKPRLTHRTRRPNFKSCGERQIKHERKLLLYPSDPLLHPEFRGFQLVDWRSHCLQTLFQFIKLLWILVL
jgi:hypothetical protein